MCGINVTTNQGCLLRVHTHTYTQGAHMTWKLPSMYTYFKTMDYVWDEKTFIFVKMYKILQPD